MALVHGKFVTMRVPYPLGFYAKNVDGRIDDPAAGWKGMETGKGQKLIVLHFQIQPNPLAD